MKLVDAPELDLTVGVMALMNSASGNIEDISRSVLNAVACFLLNQGADSECGDLNSIEGIAKGASEEYREVLDYRAYMEAARLNREKCTTCSGSGFEHNVCDQGQHGFSYECSPCKGTGKPIKYSKSIYWDLLHRKVNKEISEEEMYRLNDERLAAEAVK